VNYQNGNRLSRNNVFQFHHDERPAPAIVAMRDWTRQFWDERRSDYNLVTSAAVLDELRKGGAHHKSRHWNWR